MYVSVSRFSQGESRVVHGNKKKLKVAISNRRAKSRTNRNALILIFTALCKAL